ncbi:GNAT family N-acetyltransferase [Microlunatus speluncae]|uniref:GNAT family N-acetyltransferase n=1 Tax=Microlunatus speluncae TaxID=2594267 RepID=UPI00126609FD|nr:GNAT family N-acetyltransferase [Microlunatus speluncae]
MMITITPAGPADLPAIMALEQAGFAAAERWSEISWRDELTAPGRITLAAVIHSPTAELSEMSSPPAQLSSDKSEVLGVVVMRVTGEVADLHRIVVAADQRRLGVGRRLLAAGMEAVREAGVRSILAEVRFDNEAAIELYQRAGFEQLGARNDYYGPGKHALILKLYDLDLRPAAAGKES